MSMLRVGGLCALVFAVACGDDGSSGPSLEDFYPPLPPTGGAQGVWTGEITAATAGELLTGPAAQGQIGDFYLRNDRARFVISAPARVLGVVPQGGNVIDAALIVDGQPLPDHFGELSMIYKAGRTCEHTRLEIVADGSAGGAAVVRAIGTSGNNDFINMRGIGILPINDDINPDIEDNLDCATTYILQPGATELEVYWSVFNGTTLKVSAPFGMLNDTGGETEAWSNGRGFERAGIGALASLSEPAPIDYVVYQGPGPAYGIVPRFEDATRSAGFIIAGVSIVLFGAENLLDIFDIPTYQLVLAPKAGKLQRVDVVLGTDAEDVDQAWRAGKGESLTDVSGTVAYSDAAPAPGARVGVFLDDNGNGTIEDTDIVLSYLDVDATGAFAGKVPAAGALLLRAEVKDVGRSDVAPAGAGRALAIPAPVRLDYQIVDDATGNTIPGRVLVIGTHPAFPDKRVWDTYDRLAGVVRSVHAVQGTSTGTLADPPVYLPAGGTYKVYASRGTEWSMTSAPFAGTASGSVTLHLQHVIDTAGYLAAEFHVHQVGSPDSPVGSDERVRSALSAGVELFAVTDHDVVSDLQPYVENLAADDLLRVVPGIEVTPFAYGHFNAYPMTPLPNANGGAIDWGRGSGAGFAMTPGEIFSAARARGARVVEVNHPRGTGALGTFQQYFDRANLKYDYTTRTVDGDFNGASVPNSWLRLPDQSLWNDGFNALEIWNGFSVTPQHGARARRQRRRPGRRQRHRRGHADPRGQPDRPRHRRDQRTDDGDHVERHAGDRAPGRRGRRRRHADGDGHVADLGRRRHARGVRQRRADLAGARRRDQRADPGGVLDHPGAGRAAGHGSVRRSGAGAAGDDGAVGDRAGAGQRPVPARDRDRDDRRRRHPAHDRRHGHRRVAGVPGPGRQGGVPAAPGRPDRRHDAAGPGQRHPGRGRRDPVDRRRAGDGVRGPGVHRLRRKRLPRPVLADVSRGAGQPDPGRPRPSLHLP
ncbi:MAG: PHP domain-containing protein [Myxococcales bacterium]|nr:PHP domain-containing protein [Myxococcales bacterium]